MNQKDYSKAIYHLRMSLNLSKSEFSRSIGISSTHVSRLENGITVPSSFLLDKICEVYHVDRRYFEEEGLSVCETVSGTDFSNGISKRLKMAREKKGWSQHELARRAGVTPSVINRVEFGAKLTEKQGMKLAKALEVGYEWLMEGEEKKKCFPVNGQMIEWLWNHEEVRKKIWNQLKEETK